jgi:hypothetical protein
MAWKLNKNGEIVDAEGNLLDIVATLETLLQPTALQLTADLKQFLETRIAPIEEAIAQPAKPEKPEKPEKPADPANPLEARLMVLEQQLKEANEKQEAADRASAQLRFDKHLASVLDGFSPLHKSLLQEVLSNRFKDSSTEQGENWLTKDGKLLSEAVKEYFSTPEGKHFLPPTYSDGAGTSQPEKAKAPAAEMSTAEALAQAFL